MTRISKTTIALFGATILFFSCKKGDDPATPATPTTTTPVIDNRSPYEKIAGTWKHVENYGTSDNLPGASFYHSDYRIGQDGSREMTLNLDHTFVSTVNITEGYVTSGLYEIDDASIILHERSYKIGNTDTGYSTATYYFSIKPDTLILSYSLQQGAFITSQNALLIRKQ